MKKNTEISEAAKALGAMGGKKRSKAQQEVSAKLNNGAPKKAKSVVCTVRLFCPSCDGQIRRPVEYSKSAIVECDCGWTGHMAKPRR